MDLVEITTQRNKPLAGYSLGLKPEGQMRVQLPDLWPSFVPQGRRPHWPQKG